MSSKWSELKVAAINLRESGQSLRNIQNKLNIPKSTLSGWFKNVELSDKQKLQLEQNRTEHLIKARQKAIIWHHQQKEKHISEAKNRANTILSKIDANNLNIQELALSMLYLGEGLKTNSGTCIGSSDTLILQFFIKMLNRYYKIDINKIRCSLHLRSDQNPQKLKEYWSKELDIPLCNFTSSSIDKRSVKSPTYPTYHGVCVVNCGNIALQRKLIFLSRKFCEKIINQGS